MNCAATLIPAYSERRAIQLGLRGEVLAHYAREWVLALEDISAFVRGVHGGHPLLESRYGEKLLFDLPRKTLTIEDRNGNVHLKYQVEDLSWQWGYATFSHDANVVVLGLPYFIAIFRRTVPS